MAIKFVMLQKANQIPLIESAKQSKHAQEHIVQRKTEFPQTQAEKNTRMDKPLAPINPRCEA